MTLLIIERQKTPGQVENRALYAGSEGRSDTAYRISLPPDVSNFSQENRLAVLKKMTQPWVASEAKGIVNTYL